MHRRKEGKKGTNSKRPEKKIRGEKKERRGNK